MFAKSSKGVTLSADNLYIIGMASVFIASKYEDVVPIFMKQILDDVGHFKFTRTHILSMEREMFSTLGFKIVNTTYNSYHEASLILAELNFTQEREEAQQYLSFLSYISVYNHQIGLYQP